MKISRREFVRRVGILGGVGAAHVAMEALGLAPVPLSYAGPPSLPPQSGHGVKIVILVYRPVSSSNDKSMLH